VSQGIWKLFHWGLTENLKEVLERLKLVGQVKDEKVDFDDTKGVIGIRIEIAK